MDSPLLIPGTPSSTPSTLDRRVQGRKLDDSEVVVFSPVTTERNETPEAAEDFYEQSKLNLIREARCFVYLFWVFCLPCGVIDILKGVSF